MKKSQCFVNEAEICLYLDKEIDKIRGAALIEHIEACIVCAQKLSAWKELSNLVRGALIISKAPKHLTETIKLGLTAFTSIEDPMILPDDTGDNSWRRAQYRQSNFPIRPNSTQWN